MNLAPLFRNKFHDQPSVFEPQNLLKEARRQKGLADGAVPRICVLDPDGDLLRHLKRTNRAVLNPLWACYHTELYDFIEDGQRFGIVACVVGAPFAVLVAEELFCSGCEQLISFTSAGQILPLRSPPYFVLITRALRDEGTSYHYLAPSPYAEIQPELLSRARAALAEAAVTVVEGGVWTTDAPFRETQQAIAFARAEGLLAVEMEAAALYAFGAARGKAVLCLAHVTNRMGTTSGDFDKGEAEGSLAVLDLLALLARRLAGLGALRERIHP